MAYFDEDDEESASAVAAWGNDCIEEEGTDKDIAQRHQIRPCSFYVMLESRLAAKEQGFEEGYRNSYFSKYAVDATEANHVITRVDSDDEFGRSRKVDLRLLSIIRCNVNTIYMFLDGTVTSGNCNLRITS